MNADPGETLYAVIEEIGKDKIRTDVASDFTSSEKYCSTILRRCRALAGPDPDPAFVAKVCEALAHFMLTISMLPSQRKAVINGIDVDIVIPSAKMLLKSPDKSLIVQVLKGEGDDAKVAGASRLQPIAENIWTVSARQAGGYRNYDINDESKFARLIPDIRDFVQSKGIGGLKLVQG